MGRVREIPRTAAFAWSPNVANISLVTGTRAGAVDADFSNDTKLEVWDLDVHDSHEDPELKPVGTVASDSRYGIKSLPFSPMVIAYLLILNFPFTAFTTLHGAIQTILEKKES